MDCDDVPVSDSEPTWSPADNPYAIAVSEAQWWLRSALLASWRMHDEDDPRSGFSSRQIDARQFVVALWQLLTAEKLQQVALRALGMDRAVCAELSRARQRFETALPGIKHMRDALVHFDEWARGEGRGPQKKAVDAGKAVREVASAYWGFVYDPLEDVISLGPYVIEVPIAVWAAEALAHDIYRAAWAVDRRNAVELHTSTVDAITSAGIPCGTAEDLLTVSRGPDPKVWISLDNSATEEDRKALPEQVVAALARAGLRLLSFAAPQSDNPADRLRTGEALYVARADTPTSARC